MLARPKRNPPAAYNDGLTQAITFVVAPLLFGLLGAWIDSALGTGPVFAVGLAVFALAGVAVSTYYRYLDTSAKLDEGKPWTRRAR
jgi:hypothetical protein